MQRRFSPRINSISDEKRLYRGDDRKKLLEAPTDQGRRVSPRLRNIPDCKKPYYGSGKKKPLTTPDDKVGKKKICQINLAREFVEDESCSSDTFMGFVPTGDDWKKLLEAATDQGQRVSPGLRNIPDCKKPYYGSGKKKPLEAPDDNIGKKKICQINLAREFVENESCSMGFVPTGDDRKKLLEVPTDLGRRVSPRFCNIPDCKKPYYGSGKKKPLEAPDDNVGKKKICQINLAREFVEDESCSMGSVPTGDDLKKLLKASTDLGRRVSPRLCNIPDCKKPYYGSSKKKPLEAPDDNVEKKKICQINLAREIVEDESRSMGSVPVGDDQKKLLEAPTDLGRRVSPRLCNIPDCKKPYYGSGKKKPLEAPDGNVGKKKICPISLAREFVEDESRSKGSVPTGDDRKKLLEAPTDLGWRVSPRLCNIPDFKKPYYGSGKKKLLEAPDDNVGKKKICPINLAREFVEDENRSMGSVPTGDDQKKLLEAPTDLGRRVSPRLCNIPDCKKPYYGSGKKKPLEAPDDNVGKKKICLIYLAREFVEDESCSMGSVPTGDDWKKLLEAPTDLGRRVSPRLCNIPDFKKPYYGSGKKKPLEASDDNVGKKKICPINLAREFVEDESFSSDTEMRSVLTVNKEIEIVNSEDNLKRKSSGNSLVDKFGQGTFLKVKETLSLFNLHCLCIAQEEKKRHRNVEIRDLQIVNGSKSNLLKEIGIISPDKMFGQPPGIEVGHQFFTHAEMVSVGFHGHWLGGIDYMKNSDSKLGNYHGYTFPVAVTVVLYGQHEDGVDDLEVVYNFRGRNDLIEYKTQVNDQVTHLGNMALKNNADYHFPVRVIRGHECARTYPGKVYTYDGLYKVINRSVDNNVCGSTVFKYCLKRVKGQPKLASKNQDQFTRGQFSKVPCDWAGLVCIDISNGQEDICIPATNVIDNPPVAPSGFTYIKSIQMEKNVIVPPDAPGCNCKGRCTNSRSCSCAQLNGAEFPYVRQKGGRLIEAKDVVFECGPRCGCGPDCVNRTTQRRLRYQLEVYRTKDKGWAVRSWDFIPSGAPVCEYAGVLRRNADLDNVSENDFIFEIDCLQTMNEIGGREKRLCDVSIPKSNHVEKRNEVSENAPEFCIDAGLFGNVARFINHSCEPNLFVQCVLSSHHDIRLARVLLFAADDIPPMQELTYDYGYELDSVVGSDGKIKKLLCVCGEADCRKRLY